VGCRGGQQQPAAETHDDGRQKKRPIAFSVRVKCKRGDWAGGSRGACFPDGFWRFGELTAGP
jgi:hypothetical protein